MSKTVFSFWQTAEDDAEIFDHLADSGITVIYPRGTHKTPDQIRPLSIEEYRRAGAPDYVYLGLIGLEKFIFPEAVQHEGEQRYHILPHSSAIISYNRGIMKGNRMTPTNVSAYWHRLVDTAHGPELVPQPEDFVIWGKTLFRWLRNRAKCRHESTGRMAMTPGALETLQTGAEFAYY